MNSLTQLLEWLMNPWIDIVSFMMTIFGAVGVVLAIIFYVKGKKVKLPCYAIRSTNIVRDLAGKFESLEMLYSGQRIGNLTATKILFWNAGRDVINSEDIASADPLTVHVKEGCKILDAKIIYTKTEANQFSVTTANDRSQIRLGFDYVDKDESVVIQLLHTGKSDEDIEVRGKIKGAPKLVRKSFLTPSAMFKSSQSVRRYGIVAIGIPIPFILFTIFSPGYQNSVFLTIIFLLTFGYWGIAFDLLRRRFPKGFEVFEEGF